jgi:predicted DNA-binding transcriptional regulator AlpA
MLPIIIDTDSGHELWTATQCAEASGTARGTFTSYATRGRAPRPSTKLHGLTLWDAEVVKEWIDGRSARKSDATAVANS